MGRQPREKPARLGEKLLSIRQLLGFSQTQMAKALELEINYTVISSYELGTREPSLLVLLRYARLARTPVEFLLDDEMDLPEHLPVTGAYEWILRRKKSA
ncbi:MAG: Helix-turn-helix domain [Acidobacteriota bacterium]|nr:Helix-turn-helix domain [Acidobacteriota bacterium]